MLTNVYKSIIDVISNNVKPDENSDSLVDIKIVDTLTVFHPDRPYWETTSPHKLFLRLSSRDIDTTYVKKLISKIQEMGVNRFGIRWHEFKGFNRLEILPVLDNFDFAKFTSAAYQILFFNPPDRKTTAGTNDPENQ